MERRYVIPLESSVEVMLTRVLFHHKGVHAVSENAGK
jgi:hypothetical protein